MPVPAPASTKISWGLSGGLFQFDAAEQGIKIAVLNVVEPPDGLLLENLSRLSVAKLRVPLDGENTVGHFLCQVDFVQGHDDGDVFLPGHAGEDG